MVVISTKNINHPAQELGRPQTVKSVWLSKLISKNLSIPGAASPALLHSAALQSAHLQQLQQLQNHIHELRRSAELRSSPFLSPGNSLLHSSPGLHSQQTGYFPVFGTSGSPFTPVSKDSKEGQTVLKADSGSNVVSSTIDDDDKTGIKVGNINIISTSTSL